MKEIIIILVVFVGGCIKVGYRSYGQMAGGYKDKKIDENKYLVEYVAYGTTSDMVIEKWKRRASELCVSGYSILEFDRGNTSEREDAILYNRVRNDVQMVGTIECRKLQRIS